MSRNNARASTVAVLALVLLAVALAAAVAPGTAWAQKDSVPARLQSVDVEDYPMVALEVLLPSEGFDPTGPVPDFEVRENGEKVRISDVRSLARLRDPIDVVLVVDSSGSMRGEPLADAKSAAASFIDSLGTGDRVAVVTFAARPRIVLGFTDEGQRAKDALAGIEAGGSTALYDGVAEAASLFAGSPATGRSVVLFADGADDSSSVGLDGAVKACQEAGAAAYAVMLRSPDFDPKPLSTLASATGGRAYSISDTAQLAESFEAIAADLQNVYQVVFESRQPRTAELEIALTAESGGVEAAVTEVIDNPLIHQARTTPEETFEQAQLASRSDPVMLSVTVALFFVAAFLLVVGVSLLFAREKSALSQLEFYDQLHDRPDVTDAGGREDSLNARLMQAVGWVAQQRGILETIHKKLEQAGLPLRALEYMYIHIVVVLVVGFVSQLLTGSLLTSVFMVFVAVVGPLLALEWAIERRRRAFEEQLPEILSLIAGSVRAGWGLLQSLDLVVKETTPPASTEFRRVESEARLGLPLDAALEKMAERVGSEDLRWTVIAINIQREVGGNLAEILDILADTMRERAALKRHVRALTAEGRLSAVILYALPFAAVLGISIVRPDYFDPVLASPVGVVLMGFGLALLAVGGIWLNRVVRIEV